MPGCQDKLLMLRRDHHPDPQLFQQHETTTTLIQSFLSEDSVTRREEDRDQATREMRFLWSLFISRGEFIWSGNIIEKQFRDEFGDQFSARGPGYTYRGEDRVDRDRGGDRSSQYSWEPIPRSAHSGHRHTGDQDSRSPRYSHNRRYWTRQSYTRVDKNKSLQSSSDPVLESMIILYIG